MFKVSIVGEKSDLEKNKAALKLAEFQLQFVDKNDFRNFSVDEDAALVVLPWNGFKEIYEYAGFKKHLDQRSVIVVGPAMYFFEIEDRVIDGSICFLSNPVNSMQIESVINEILRIRGGAFQGELAGASA